MLEGQHQIGGFKVSVGWALRKCRICYAKVEDVRGNFDPKSFILRDQNSHVSICQRIENTSDLKIKSELQTTYGIIYRSALLSINDFDITKQLPHDVMHVVLEGILPYECQLSLSVLMEQGLFTLEEFNQQLVRFQFSYADAKSKPESLKPTVFVTGERKLKFSAENSKIFIKILPFLLEPFVDKEDVFFEFLMEISKIVQIVYSPVISTGTVGYLEDLIRQHYVNFQLLFPESYLIPKHHYLLEVPEMIHQFGPPVRYCCMRFEAMHKIFKSFVPVVSFKALCLSLSQKYLNSVATEIDLIF